VPVPSSIDDLDAVAANNSPSGSDQRSQADDYLRAQAAFVAQLRDRTSGIINVTTYGAACDGTTDDTAAWVAAIESVGGANVANHITMPAYSTSKIDGTVYLPPHVTIDLAGGWLVGDDTNTMFETGYWSGGSVVTNHGQAAETQIVDKCRVVNGEIRNCDIAFNLYNFCEGSEVSNIRMAQVNQAIYAYRCFYGKFDNILSRAPLDDEAYPCFHFHDEVNNVQHDGLRAVGYETGHKISGAKRGLVMTNIGAEGCVDGIVIDNNTLNMAIVGGYFETLTGTAIKFNDSGNHDNVFVDWCWFDLITTAAISGTTIQSGEWGQNNRLGNGVVTLSTDFANRMKVHIPTDVTADNTSIALPAAYTLGDACNVDYIKAIYDSGSGLVTNKARVFHDAMPVVYGGDVGGAVVGTVPFATLNVASTTVTVDTTIRYRDEMMGGYSLTITATGTQIITGLFVGSTSVALQSSGKTVTLSNQAGYLRIVVSGLTSASACTGVLRLFQ
jgi:hypothetical protein